MEKWPNFFIVGAPRAGTTSLYYYLREIPEIYMSALKEPRYFNSSEFKNIYRDSIRDKKKYLKFFHEVKNEIAVGEASTSYLQDPASPILIRQVVPAARIIIILRDPIERAFSHYLMSVQWKETKLPFHEIIRMGSDSHEKDPYLQVILGAGFYSQQVKRYLDTFGSDHVKILFFEEFIRDPKEKVEEILRFLDINHRIYDFKGDVHNEFAGDRIPYGFAILNNPTITKIGLGLIPLAVRLYLRKKILTKETAKPKMAEEDRVFLQNLYRADVQKLHDVLGRQFPWDNFKNL